MSAANCRKHTRASTRSSDGRSVEGRRVYHSVRGPEVWAVSYDGIERVSLATGLHIEKWPAQALSLVPPADKHNVLVRRSGELVRLDLTTGTRTSAGAAIGDPMEHGYGALHVEVNGTTDDVDVYLATAYGVERVRASRTGAIFESGFE